MAIRTVRRVLGSALAIGALACVPTGHGSLPAAAPVRGSIATRSTGHDRPGLAIVGREGDAQGALGVAAITEGIAPDRGATVGVALAALVETRLSGRGFAATTVGGSAGWRLNVLIASPSEAATFVEAVRAALLTPVAADEPALAAIARKTEALARLPRVDPARVDIVRCTGEAYGSAESTPPTAAELEAWRAAAHGLGRVAIAVAGGAPLANATAAAIERGAPWPASAPILPASMPNPNGRTVVYDASGALAPGSARVTVVAATASPERAVSAGPTLGDAHGSLQSRLAALEAPAHLTSVVATAHARGGCVAATIDLAARDLATDAPARIATAAALAREEVAVELADAPSPADMGRTLASGAADPRDAAERAAWWSLAAPRTDLGRDAFGVSLFVGIAPPRDAAEGTPPATEAIRTEIDRATLAWHAPVVDARMRVERGQGETWVVIGSPCGTLPEAASDAGAGATVATAASTRAAEPSEDVRVEPFVTAEGVGVVVHGPARPDETPQAHARRLADAGARAFAAEALDEGHVARARSLLLVDASMADARALSTLASALAPGHPSWIVPGGTVLAHASASDEAIAIRAAAMRGGPLRVAVVADTDTAQAEAAVRAVDRWIARRPGESRACPVPAALPPPRPGTYAVSRPAGAGSEALLGFALPAGDATTRSAATWLAASLAGEDGMLAHALGADPASGRERPLARSWDATVLGLPRAGALVVRVVATDDALDAAVAQVRGLLDRVRQGAVRDDDLQRASLTLAKQRLASMLDPRERALALWRGDVVDVAPALDTVRALAAGSLRDEAMVAVAARPTRLESPAPRTATPRDPKSK
jgi:hypothetical protein